MVMVDQKDRELIRSGLNPHETMLTLTSLVLPHLSRESVFSERGSEPRVREGAGPTSRYTLEVAVAGSVDGVGGGGGGGGGAGGVGGGFVAQMADRMCCGSCCWCWCWCCCCCCYC